MSERGASWSASWGPWLMAAALVAGAFACAGACGQRASDPPAADTTAADLPEPAPAPADEGKPAQDAPCNGEPCKPPEQCIQYSGIAGPKVPLFTCGIPCSAEGACPTGKTCQTIADGPRLCR